jgi:hypothetical protein
MNFKYITIVTVLAATLVGTAAITADSAFATKYKEKNQAVSQANACGNGATTEYWMSERWFTDSRRRERSIISS